MTFTQGEFLFHYTARQGIVTLVITGELGTGGSFSVLKIIFTTSSISYFVLDADFERATAFQFLDSVMEKFLRQVLETPFIVIQVADILSHDAGIPHRDLDPNQDAGIPNQNA